MFSLVFIAVALVALLVIVVLVMRNYRRYRGTRLVVCPETHQAAAVRLDAGVATETAIYQEKPELRLSACSRWPEREGCGQECLSQIERAPHDCLVRTIVTRWYEGRSCVLCRQPIRDVDWSFHQAALVKPGFPTTTWTDLRPENLPAVLQTAAPVCWSCHLGETFRREHAELVTERPWPRAALH